MTLLKLRQSRRGRPRKFGRPSRAVTLTLPEDIIAALQAMDEDVSRAVVRLSEPTASRLIPKPAAELAPYGHSAVIVVKPVAALERIQGVRLVPLADGRALISLDETMTDYEFELRLRDALEDPAGMPAGERSALRAVAEILKVARRTKGVRVEHRSIIVLQSTRHRKFVRDSLSTASRTR